MLLYLLDHIKHRHIWYSAPGVGRIQLCYRRKRVDAHVLPEGSSDAMCLHDVSTEDIKQLLSVKGPDNQSVTGVDRLLFVAGSIRMRRQNPH